MSKTMTRCAVWGAASTLLALSGCSGRSEPIPRVEIGRAVTPLPATADLAVIYLILRSDGGDDVLVGASSPRAAEVSLHRTVIDASGTAMMGKRESLDLPDGQEVQLSAGGDHLMVTQPGPLVVGDRYDLELEFDKAAPVTVEVTVVAPGAAG